MMARCGTAAPGATLRWRRYSFVWLLQGLLLAWPGFSLDQAAAGELRSWKGGPAPALELTGLDGGRYRLSDFRGQVVLVNFWATWCEPCREEMPSIQRLNERLSGRAFAVLTVNLEEPEARIRTFLSRNALDLTVLRDTGRNAAKLWNARILPASFLIGPEGAIRYRAVGEIDWNDGRVIERVVRLLPTTR